MIKRFSLKNKSTINGIVKSTIKFLKDDGALRKNVLNFENIRSKKKKEERRRKPLNRVSTKQTCDFYIDIGSYIKRWVIILFSSNKFKEYVVM